MYILMSSFVRRTSLRSCTSLRECATAPLIGLASRLAPSHHEHRCQCTLPMLSTATPEAESMLSERLASGSQASSSSSAKSDEVAQHGGVLKPGLYLVGTPIGNLEDITLRALRVLKEVELVLAEDTRHSRKLLNHYGIHTRLMSFHEHNESSRKEQVLANLDRGARVAIISDAGALVAAAITEGHSVIPIPGPSAVLSALVGSGLPASSFMFCGFLPPKTGARIRAIEALAGVPASLIFYVPPHSLLAILEDLAAVLGPLRRCTVARELTKLHEEFIRGNLISVADNFKQHTVKGEITLIVEGRTVAVTPPNNDEIEQEVLQLLDDGVSVSSAAKLVAKSLGLSRSAVYDVALKAKSR